MGLAFPPQTVVPILYAAKKRSQKYDISIKYRQIPLIILPNLPVFNR